MFNLLITDWPWSLESLVAPPSYNAAAAAFSAVSPAAPPSSVVSPVLGKINKRQIQRERDVEADQHPFA